MSFANSSSDFLRFRQNPRCPGPSGPQGPGGATGPTGPQGPAGSNGVSVGQNYFFNLAGNIVTNTGPTGGNLDLYSYNAGANTAYTGSDYSGYFIQQSATAGTGSYVNVARFTSVAGLQSPIPAGVWTFYNNIYSFTGPTGTIGTWAIPPPPGTTNEVYAVVSYVDGATGGKIFETSPKNIDLSDDLVILNGYVQSPITLNNPTGAYFYVDYLATNRNSRNVIEFWTQGNSVAYVTTTFSPQQGSQGNTGATGPQGPQGLPGPAGTTIGTAQRLAWFSSNNTVNSTPGITTTDGTTLTIGGTLNVGVNTNFGNQAIGGNLGAGGTTTIASSVAGNPTIFNWTNGQNYLRGTTQVQGNLITATGTTLNIDGDVSNTSGPINFINGGGILVNQTATVGALTSVGNISAANLGGTYNNFLIGNIRIQTGSGSFGSSPASVNFPVSFSGAPVVSITLSPPPAVSNTIVNGTITNFRVTFTQINSFNVSYVGAGICWITWIAIGPA
jgi:hypothetical protein